jgi:hypothetical protein
MERVIVLFMLEFFREEVVREDVEMEVTGQLRVSLDAAQ